MGAFGRLLIEYWGGDLARYEGSGSHFKPEVPKVKSDKDLEEDDELLLERVSQAAEGIIEKGENMMKMINSNDIYHHFKTEKGMDKFEKWKNKFLKKVEE